MNPPLYPVKLHSRQESRIGFIDASGEMVWDVAGEFPASVLVSRVLIRRQQELLLFDDQGREINRIRGDRADSYVNGFCIVETATKDQTPTRIGKYDKGLVDLSGKWIVEPEYAGITNVFEKFYARRKKENEMYSLYSVEGEIILRAFDLFPSRVSEGVISSSDFARPGLLGYRCIDGSWLIEPRYDTALPFFNGIAPVVSLTKRKHTASLIHRSGEEASALPKIEGFQREGFSNEGVIGFYSPKKDGYLDWKGQILIEGKFDALGKMQCRAAPVKVDGAWGLIGADGTWRRKPEFGSFYHQHGPFFAFFKERLPVGQIVVLNSEGTTIWPKR